VLEAPLRARLQSMLDAIRWHLPAGRRVELDNTVLHGFSTTTSFGAFIERLIEAGPRNRIIHFGGSTKVTAFELGQALAVRFGLDPGKISPKGAAGQSKTDFQDLSLNCSTMNDLLKIKPLLLQESLDLIEKHLVTHA
jgi:dTDP-4-dehydrorhamnose reductase